MKLYKLLLFFFLVPVIQINAAPTDQLITLVDKARRNDPYLQADIQELIKQGANAKAKNAAGRPAIASAAFHNYPETVKVLITGGADVDATDANGDTALLIAARQGNVESVMILINNFADITIINKEGKTALSVAGENATPAKKKQVVDYLSSFKKQRLL